jgi:hypothetical protein
LHSARASASDNRKRRFATAVLTLHLLMDGQGHEDVTSVALHLVRGGHGRGPWLGPGRSGSRRMGYGGSP